MSASNSAEFLREHLAEAEAACRCSARFQLSASTDLALIATLGSHGRPPSCGRDFQALLSPQAHAILPLATSTIRHLPLPPPAAVAIASRGLRQCNHRLLLTSPP